jgi:sugar phosphate isomerase/epimerase
MRTTRREFLQAAALLPLATGSMDPIARNGKPHARLSIAAYSYNKQLDLKKPTMTLDDFIDKAAEMGTDAVELTAYYFPKTTPDYLAHLKGRCTRLGLDVSGAAVGNNFCKPKADDLKKEISHVKQWIEHTCRLGGKTLRIFAGNVEKGDTEENARARCIAAIQESCDHAAKYGVFLGLENHGGITSTIEQMMKLVTETQHPWLGVNWDSGNFHSDDPYADLERLAPYAVNVQLKTQIRRKNGKKEPSDFPRLLAMLNAAKYRGYVALEYEGGDDAMTAVPLHIANLRKLMENRS